MNRWHITYTALKLNRTAICRALSVTWLFNHSYKNACCIESGIWQIDIAFMLLHGAANGHRAVLGIALERWSPRLQGKEWRVNASIREAP